MKNHIFRPLFVFIGIVLLVLLARIVLVPKDFGVGERGYMYGWHRLGNEEEWKNTITKVKYQGSEYCKDCHPDKYDSIGKTPHRIIQCENCHGPAIDHPSDPPKLEIDRSRELCLRCHFPLPYTSSGRAKLKSIDPDTHNPDSECSSCHNPHKPMEGLR
ncbi:MAG: cytochrome c3 family protein [Nitrospirae bacterium]|nr:cytochrome c3 family protein [Nitrospirota bacterium]